MDTEYVMLRLEDEAKEYRFYIEQRNNKTLVLNIDTGVWKIDEEYNELFKSVGREKNYILSKKQKEYEILLKDKMLDEVDISTEVDDKFRLLIFETSEKCNMQCKYCFEDAQIKGCNMTLETAMKAVNLFMGLKKCADTVNIEFNGGEVTLNFPLVEQVVPKILEVANRKKKKVRFSMQTNGTHMTDEMACFLKQYNFSVGISLDGTPEYNKNRILPNGEETFEIVLNTIRVLKKHQVPYSTISVICQRGQFNDTVELLRYTECKQYRANLKRTLGRGGQVDESITLEELAREYVEYCKKMLNEKKYYEANLHYYFMSLYLYNPFMCYKEPCGTGRNQLYFAANGDIYACQQSCYIQQGKLGTVNETVEELQNQLDQNNWIKEIQKRKTCEIEECKACSWKKFCFTCPCKEMGVDKTVHTRSTFCEFNKYVLHELMWFAGENNEVVMNYLQYNY